MNSINLQAPRLWLSGILASLAVNLHKMQLNFKARKAEMKIQNAEACALSLLDKDLRKITRDALQDLIDLVIPLSIVGWIDISPGTVGLAGSVTSLMGAAAIYPSS